jgi:purine-binding chemotaxis protein CheW
VQEVVEWEPLEKAPRTPPFVLGVFNYHGRVVTVVDISEFFGENSREITSDTRIIVLAGEELSIGFKVDRTNRIENFSKDSLRYGASQPAEKGFVKAVVNHEGRLYNLIDLERLLGSVEDRFETVVQRS